MDEPLHLLIDMGGTKTLVCFLRGNRVLACSQRETRGNDSREVLANLFRHLEESRGPSLHNLAAIGIAVAGIVDTGCGTIVHSANLPFTGFPICRKISERFDVPVLLETDANAATLAEYFSRKTRPMTLFAYVTISTGIGMGVVQDGKILQGARGGMGEIGHMIVDAASGIPCPCGRVGCLEALASGRALHAISETLEIPGRASLPDYRHKPVVVALAEQGDQEAMARVERAARYLGDALDTVSQLLDPEMLVLGGGVMQSDLIFEKIQLRYRQLRRTASHGPRTLTRSQLGRFAPVLGMARLLDPDFPLETFPHPSLLPET